MCVGMGKWVGVVGGWMEQWWVGDGGPFNLTFLNFFQLVKMVSVIAVVLKQVPLMRAWPSLMLKSLE